MSAIYLIRHGQASFGRADYDNLSELGQEQARFLGATLRGRIPSVHAVITGAMLRHKQTAQHCLSAMSCRFEAREDAGFNEFDHEELLTRLRPRYASKLVLGAELAASLRPRQMFQELFAQAVDRWMSGEHDHEYKESWVAFRARCTAALERVVSSLGSSKTALVFTSAGPITAICQDLLGMPDKRALKQNTTMVNCAITKVIVGRQGLHLSSLNEHGHFEGDGRRLVTYR